MDDIYVDISLDSGLGTFAPAGANIDFVDLPIERLIYLSVFGSRAIRKEKQKETLMSWQSNQLIKNDSLMSCCTNIDWPVESASM